MWGNLPCAKKTHALSSVSSKWNARERAEEMIQEQESIEKIMKCTKLPEEEIKELESRQLV